MKKIDLTDYSNSDVKFKIDNFQDGELDIYINEALDRSETYQVICRIRNAAELFLVLQLGDILDRNEVDWHLEILYLMGMKDESLRDFFHPFRLKVLSRLINSMNFNIITVCEPTAKAETLFGDRLYSDLHDIFIVKDTEVIVYPSEKIYKQYKWQFSDNKYIVFDDTTFTDSGTTYGYEIIDESLCIDPNSTFVFVTNICDDGISLIEEVKKLKERFPNATYKLIVYHMINEVGFTRICANFDFITTTNSYKDYQDDDFIKVVNVK